MRTRTIVLSSMVSLMIAGLFMFIMVHTATAETNPECGYSDIVFNEDHTLAIKKWVYCAGEQDWTWDITKSADATSLTLSPGEQYAVNYTVTANATAKGSYAVDGWIWVQNLSDTPVMINSVTDDLADTPLVCILEGNEVTLPVELPTTVLACKYSGTLDNQASENRATATYDTGKSITAVAAIDWSSAAMSETDKCADVTDSLAGVLGQVCAGDKTTFTFNYPITVGPYDVCGDYTVDNTATVTEVDSGDKDTANWSVDINVPCAGGCSLTPGYWKTHSEFGPAPYDDTWAQLPSGASTPFYLSGKTYYQVLWTAPQGNAYYILAHAYIAAKLNILNGAATTPAVDAALTQATVYFSTLGPTPAPSGALRSALLGYATTLDNYNNGLIGPGHCSE